MSSGLCASYNSQKKEVGTQNYSTTPGHFGGGFVILGCMRKFLGGFFLILIIEPLFLFPALFLDSEILYMISLPFIFLAPYILFLLSKIINIESFIDFNKHFHCDFWCTPLDLVGFLTYYIPWVLLLLIIFGPLLYFTRKK